MQRGIRSALVPFLLAGTAVAQGVEEFHFELTTLGGRTVSHQDFEDNVLLVDFWGTWCGPCVSAVPVLQKLYAKYKHYGLEIVGLTYEQGAPAAAADGVRKFAAKKGLTYPIALGTPAEKRQVPDFGGYPTMLRFAKGLECEKVDTGLHEGWEAELETWIRVSLGLPVDDGSGAGTEARPSGDEPRDDFDPPAADEPKPLPDGVIFKPGDGDTGFDFEVEDVDGGAIAFGDLRGKPVLLALTSTWDGEAARTAKLLDTLHGDLGTDVAVLAASLEIKKQRAARVAAIDGFRKTHGLTYRIFPAGLAFQRKIHLFSGMPLFLVFDADGVLVLRESGASEEVDQKIRERLGQLR